MRAADCYACATGVRTEKEGDKGAGQRGGRGACHGATCAWEGDGRDGGTHRGGRGAAHGPWRAWLSAWLGCVW